MRSCRQARRGLAEIVGTLMLVLIVVAAAVSFSLFVASYQTQVQNEERQSHDRALEGFHVVAVKPTNVTPTGPTGAYQQLTVDIVSSDVNYLNFSGFSFNGVDFSAVYANSSTAQYHFNASGTNTSCPAPNDPPSCTMLAPFAPAAITFVTLAPVPITKTIDLNFFTKLSNEFSYVFVPPVSIIKSYFVEVANGTSVVSYVVMDGSSSFQPTTGANASLVSYAWTFQNVAVQNNTVVGHGQAFEPPVANASTTPPLLYSVLQHGATYDVTLTVTNSDGLFGVASVSYHQD